MSGDRKQKRNRAYSWGQDARQDKRGKYSDPIIPEPPARMVQRKQRRPAKYPLPPHLAPPTVTYTDLDVSDWSKWEGVKTFPFSSEGEVTLSKYKPTNKLYVLKTLKAPYPPNTADSAHYEPRKPNEAEMLLTHLRPIAHRMNRLIALHACIYNPSPSPTFTLCMDYCDGGDLFDLIKRFHNRNVQIPRVFVQTAFLHLSEALAFLHHGLKWSKHLKKYESIHPWRQIIHRDIKPENIFLRWPSRRPHPSPLSSSPTSSTEAENHLPRLLPDIVLADFGHACLSHQSKGIWGTNAYFAPELYNAYNTLPYSERRALKISTPATDVWTLGAVVYQLETLRLVDGSEVDGSEDSVLEREWLDEKYGTRLNTAVWGCLRTEMERRPSARYLVRGFGREIWMSNDMERSYGERMPEWAWED